ncbi:hypothetical protein CSKR_200399 [Clonorchis sinensis]|uniref:Uncharacterized protein n=1 Tax=Clonorchis sinensis TaxID=79923 RepID=A0A8T1MCK9_CLOSI|nr:hypothetical protein CSKR_200399 [Clonorchis sinensis]
MLRRFEKHIPKINLASKRSHVACSIFRARLIKSDTLMRDSKRHLPSLLDNAFRPIAVAERLARNTTSWLQLPGGGVINYGKLVLKYRFTEANQTTVVKNLEMPWVWEECLGQCNPHKLKCLHWSDCFETGRNVESLPVVDELNDIPCSSANILKIESSDLMAPEEFGNLT